MKDNIQDFLRFLEVDKKYAENTIAAYQNDLTQFRQNIRQSQDGEEIEDWNDISRNDINEYIEYLKNSGYTSSTVARKVAAIKSFFHFLLAEGELKDDPTFTLDSPKVKKRLPKAISPAEIDKILRAPADEIGPKAQRDLALLEMLYASGMRVTELVSLNVSDITFDPNNPKNATVRVKGKRASKERVIPISGGVVSTLQLYIKQAREQLIHDPKEDAVFLNNRGQRLTRQGLWLIIKHYVEVVGISSQVTPHTLRHSFAAHKLSQGKSLQDIQKLLGHANISTTQVYAHLGRDSD
ncbi:MAG: Tyrosine recombinase XerD [Anaerolineae bacterium]|nr:Tyrosine recombinase XerD [Anaerolineae bacterium]